MAITVQTGVANKQIILEQTGMTDGNEYIFQVDPKKTYVVQGTETSAGTATLKVSSASGTPTDFTNFVSDSAGAQSATFNRFIEGGVGWIGIDIASGTWSISIAQVV